MREIKFRAWDGKKMIIPSSLSSDPEMMTWTGVVFKDGIWQSQYVMMQYTGLKDKTGKEIYEGDIVEIVEATLSIEYYFDGFKMKALWATERTGGRVAVPLVKTQSTWKSCRVIGNIYQNPELL